jgi:hypothetical protein
MNTEHGAVPGGEKVSGFRVQGSGERRFQGREGCGYRSRFLLLAERERQRKADKIGVGVRVGIGVEKESGMAFGHEKLDSASEGMLFAKNRANTERKKSTAIPIPTPTPKKAMIGNRQPPAGGDGIPRLRRDDLRHVRIFRPTIKGIRFIPICLRRGGDAAVYLTHRVFLKPET